MARAIKHDPVELVEVEEQATHLLQQLNKLARGSHMKWRPHSYLRIQPGTTGPAITAYVVGLKLCTPRDIKRGRFRLVTMASVWAATESAGNFTPEDFA